jgi:hypothetical protein
MGRIICGVDPCPSCGSQFRVVDLDEPNLIQCNICRHDEKIDPSEVSEYERERLENRKRGLIAASQLSNLLKVRELSEDTIYRYAKAGTIPSVNIDGEVLFNLKQIARWLKELLNTGSGRQH